MLTIIFVVLVVLGFLFQFLASVPVVAPAARFGWSAMGWLVWFIASLLWGFPQLGGH